MAMDIHQRHPTSHSQRTRIHRIRTLREDNNRLSTTSASTTACQLHCDLSLHLRRIHSPLHGLDVLFHNCLFPSRVRRARYPSGRRTLGFHYPDFTFHRRGRDPACSIRKGARNPHAWLCYHGYWLRLLQCLWRLTSLAVRVILQIVVAVGSGLLMSTPLANLQAQLLESDIAAVTAFFSVMRSFGGCVGSDYSVYCFQYTD
jgi:hypothetical protein